MPPPENHHVKSERAAMHARMVEGLNTGVDMPQHEIPPWIQRIYVAHGPYQRGLLLGVLLEEMERNAPMEWSDGGSG